MRKTILISSVCFAVFSLIAQNKKCGTMDNYLVRPKSMSEAFATAEQRAALWRQQNFSAAKSQNTVTIPVVFHCVYKSVTDVTYIPDSVFQRQIEVLNETYGLTNSNFSATRPIFDTLATNTGIQFCLAGFDPQGNPSNGIVRYQSSQNWLSSITNDAIKTAYPPWDPSRYLNVWTCDMSLLGIPFVLGYATFPGEPAATDGIVLQAEFVGFQNNGTPNNLGRTMVHEAGHYFGLRHIWGDGQQSSVPCDSTDYVDDTPHAADASQTDCDTTKNTCSIENVFWSQLGIDPPDMVENYMDYSTDGCMTMFTKGQRDRMWSFINTTRSGFLNNPVACNTIGIGEGFPNLSGAVSLYPNPVSSLLNIHVLPHNNQEINVTVMNAMGEMVSQFKMDQLQQKIDVSHFSKGLYLIRLSNNKTEFVKKIIID